jgi:signal transduction histidine kinase/HAMP domain-containing protein/ActR/RegA family two-component response regulator
MHDVDLRSVPAAIRALRDSDFRTRLPADHGGVTAELALVLDQIADRSQHLTDELNRVRRELDRPLRGDLHRLARCINRMVEELSLFTDEVNSLAREVGVEGRLGGHANVRGLSGGWRVVTESVNTVVDRLTAEVRDIVAVTKAVADGDLTRSVTAGANGELLELKLTVNRMVDQFSWFAAEITQLARELGAEVPAGDLEDNINLMVTHLREKDWLESNLTRLAALLQGDRDLREVADLILRELARLAGAQYGAFFLAGANGDGERIVLPDGQVRRLVLIAGYGLPGVAADAPEVLAQGLVREAIVEERRILVDEAPADYITISSALGRSSRVSVVIIPILCEGRLLGVIELASFARFSDIHLALFDRFVTTIGFVIDTILAHARTEDLVSQSQQLATRLQERTDELQTQQIELQHSHEELEEEAALLTLASQHKSEFLANMSHELRTPLSSMVIYARLLADNPRKSLSQEEVAFATSIHRACSDLLQLIDDVLDLSKVEARRLDIRSRKVSIIKLIDYVNTTFHPIVDERGLDLRVEVSADAPEEICSDEQRIQQILRNLLSNAIKFTSAGRVTLRVWCPDGADTVLSGPGDVIAFTVEDTGIGIPRDKLVMIFEAFEQAHRGADREYGGAGLGLSISREFATLLGGRITAESEPGSGSAFTLYLPVIWPERTPSQEPGHKPATEGVSAGRRLRAAAEDPARLTAIMTPLDEWHAERVARRLTGKVLIVDDDLCTVTALTQLLKRVGVPVLHAPNGQEGMEALQCDPDVSLVLMDIMMPVLNGYEAIKAIRRLPGYAELPIIVLSAKAVPGEREKVLAGGATEYLQKPIIDVDRLLEIAYEHLDCGKTTEMPPTAEDDPDDT